MGHLKQCFSSGAGAPGMESSTAMAPMYDMNFMPLSPCGHSATALQSSILDLQISFWACSFTCSWNLAQNSSGMRFLNTKAADWNSGIQSLVESRGGGPRGGGGPCGGCGGRSGGGGPRGGSCCGGGPAGGEGGAAGGRQ